MLVIHDRSNMELCVLFFVGRGHLYKRFHGNPVGPVHPGRRVSWSILLRIRCDTESCGICRVSVIPLITVH